MNDSCKYHSKEDGSWWEVDAKGIPLARVCDECIKERLEGFNPGVLRDFQQEIVGIFSDESYEDVVDEQIEEDY